MCYLKCNECRKWVTLVNLMLYEVLLCMERWKVEARELPNAAVFLADLHSLWIVDSGCWMLVGSKTVEKL